MKFLKLTAIILIAQISNLKAQSIVLKETELNDDNKISFCKPLKIVTSTTESEKIFLSGIVQSSNDSLRFKLIKSIINKNETHNFYEFLLFDIPIVGADYVVHSVDGIINFANGKAPIVPKILNYKPSLSISEAETHLNTILLEKNKSRSNISFEYNNRGIVWFYFEKKLTLAYEIETSGKNIVLHGDYFMDAQSGKLLSSYNFICSFNESNEITPNNSIGTAQTLYNGAQSLTTDDNFNGGFRLREIRNGVSIITKNANFDTDAETLVNSATDFFDNNNNWETAEHFNDIQAHDVHWASEKVLDYFRLQHNRNSLDDNGLQIRSFLHVKTLNDAGVAISMDNAYYYGGPFNASSTHSFYYGDGNTIGKPFVSLDIVAHEIAHGIDEYTSGLIRNLKNQGEALNEGLSDIWAATIEHWAAPNKQPWLIGEEVMNNGFSCIRSLRSPKTEGFRNNFTTEGHYPDTYLGTNWDNLNLDSHRNSTVIGHWYYLLVNGGNGTNDLGNIFTVNGIGFDKAASIVYKTQKDYLNTNADFAMMRNVSIQATRVLFGTYSCEEIAITNAWYAVGVGSKFIIDPTTYQINGPVSFTTTGTYVINQILPANYNVIWSCNVPCVTILQNGSNAVVNNNSFIGVVTLTASITNGCVTIPLSKQIQVSSLDNSITGPLTICSSGSAYNISNVPCNGIVSWTIACSSGGNPTLSTTIGNSTSINIPSGFPSSATLTLTANVPGTNTPITKTIFYGLPGFGASYKNGVTAGNPVAIYFPSQGNNNIFNNVCIGYGGVPNVYIDAQPWGTNNVTWSVPNGYTTSAFSLYTGYGNRAYFGWNYGGATPPGYIQAAVSNGCGTYSQIFAFKQVNCNPTGGDPCTQAKGVNYFTISPNPASDNIKIGIGNKPAPINCNNLKALNTSSGIVFSSVNVYDNLGTLVKSYKTKDSKTAIIDISNLIVGSYMVEIIQGDYIEKQQIIVQK